MLILFLQNLVDFLLCLCPLKGAGGIMFLGCLPMCLFIFLSIGQNESLERDNSRMHEGNSLKSDGSINYDMMMNWFHISKVKVTTGANLGKNSVWYIKTTNKVALTWYLNILI